MRLLIASLLLFFSSSIHASPTFIGPISPYLSTADSPFIGQSSSPFNETDLGYRFFLEDFEDGLLETGVTAVVKEGVFAEICTTGQVINGLNCGTADSVDADDGVIDGWGTAGYSFHVGSAANSILFAFDEAIFGFLPTHVGIVVTDGASTNILEAFDANGVSLGTVTEIETIFTGNGTTAGDSFLGVINEEGISAIRITASGSGIEVDHLQWGSLAVPGPSIVTIDIKPGSDPNYINLNSKGVIPVAILSTEDFDAGQVDPDTVTFGPNHAPEAHLIAHMEDIDGDGDYDQVFHFRVQEAGITCGDIEAILTGETFDGTPISGAGAIRTVACN